MTTLRIFLTVILLALVVGCTNEAIRVGNPPSMPTPENPADGGGGGENGGVIVGKDLIAEAKAFITANPTWTGQHFTVTFIDAELALVTSLSDNTEIETVALTFEEDGKITASGSKIDIDAIFKSEDSAKSLSMTVTQIDTGLTDTLSQSLAGRSADELKAPTPRLPEIADPDNNTPHIPKPNL